MPKGVYPHKKGQGGKKGRSGIYKRGKIKHWKLSSEQIKKISERMKGSGNHRWIKDRTLLKKSDNKMDDVQYIYWSNQIKRRDNWKCKLLSKDCNGRLESHHIFNWIEYPKLRYILTNGITLCAFHHPRGREKEKRMIPIFQELLSVSE